MDRWHSLVRIAVVMILLYVATIIELTLPEQDVLPSALALAVTATMCLTRRSTIFWSAMGGLLIDITSAGRLGPCLVAYGVVATVFVRSATTQRNSWWFVPSVAFAFAAIQPLTVMIAARLADAPGVELTASLLTACTRGGATACAAALALLLMVIVQRVLQPMRTDQPLALTNRWDMITN